MLAAKLEHQGSIPDTTPAAQTLVSIDSGSPLPPRVESSTSNSSTSPEMITPSMSDMALLEKPQDPSTGTTTETHVEELHQAVNEEMTSADDAEANPAPEKGVDEKRSTRDLPPRLQVDRLNFQIVYPRISQAPIMKH
jgi:hypothetical protein